MSKIILVAFALVYFGCKAETSDVSSYYSLPDAISDCKIYELSNGQGRILYLARCPFSETSVSWNSGKVKRYTTTIELDTNGLGEYKRLKEKFELK